ncbi:hypothetical protein ACEPAH_8822 [Sanghuangporus vaninii]
MPHIRLTLRQLYASRRLSHNYKITFGFRNASYKAKSFVPNERGPNIHILRWLAQEMENKSCVDAEDGPYKVRAFQRACKAIDALPEPITSGAEALKIVGIGEGIARRIDEYLNQDSEHIPPKPPPPQKTPEEIEREKCLKEFKRVPGIGPIKAMKLYDAGCRSLADLKRPEYSKSLASPSRAALDYVDHLGERVTRAEVDSVIQTIRPLISSEIRMYPVGSFRRGLPTCSDIDIIFFHPSCVYVPRPGERTSNGSSSPLSTSKRRRRPIKNGKSPEEKQETLLRELIIGPLERAGILAATLSEGSRKWQGIVRIRKDEEEEDDEGGDSESDRSPWIYRRMDLSLYPTLSEGAALLATTGDTDFNAHTRRNASKMGLLLNEFGLWKFCRRNPTALSSYDKKESYTEEDGHWELVASKTETEILDALTVEYVEPERRNFAFVVSRSKQGKGSLLKSRGSVVSELRRGKPK